jgi:hypothetical protein
MSGVVSGIKDTFFGGSEKKAAKAQQQGFRDQIASIERGKQTARKEFAELFPQARESSRQGFQSALDVFSSSLPQMTNAFQGGNVAARETLLAGLPQIQAALLGQQTDFSQLQPFRQQVDLGFTNQQLPEIPQQQVQQQPMLPSNGPSLDPFLVRKLLGDR